MEDRRRACEWKNDTDQHSIANAGCRTGEGRRRWPEFDWLSTARTTLVRVLYGMSVSNGFTGLIVRQRRSGVAAKMAVTFVSIMYRPTPQLIGERQTR